MSETNPTPTRASRACIDPSALPIVAVLRLASGLGFRVHQSPGGCVHFTRDPDRKPNRMLLRALGMLP
jgi:hypothetical protein